MRFVLFLLFLASPSFAATTPPTAISIESVAVYTLAGAAKYCDGLNESAQTDWYLPVLTDLAVFFDTAASTKRLWTRSILERNQLWVTTRLSDGANNAEDPLKFYNVRCVR